MDQETFAKFQEMKEVAAQAAGLNRGAIIDHFVFDFLRARPSKEQFKEIFSNAMMTSNQAWEAGLYVIGRLDDFETRIKTLEKKTA